MPLTPNRQPDPPSTGRIPVFVVGSPRSGTTWLQLMLAQHPAVATCQETHVFERYLAHLEEVWRGELTDDAERDIGLRSLIAEDEFLALCRAFAVGVLDRIEPGDPDKRIVLEKTPGHVLSAPFISALFPEAHFVHVIRDPRGVANSLLEAGKGWGRRWAPRGPATAARVWRKHVDAGLKISELSERYHEIQYERLHESGPEELQRLVTNLGLTGSPDWSRKAFDACSIERLKSGDGDARIPWTRAEPKGFYGAGRLGTWQARLSKRQIRTIEYVAGETMLELGYERVTRGGAKPLVVRYLESLERIRESLDWRLGRASAEL